MPGPAFHYYGATKMLPNASSAFLDMARKGIGRDTARLNMREHFNQGFSNASWSIALEVSGRSRVGLIIDKEFSFYDSLKAFVMPQLGVLNRPSFTQVTGTFRRLNPKTQITTIVPLRFNYYGVGKLEMEDIRKRALDIMDRWNKYEHPDMQSQLGDINDLHLIGYREVVEQIRQT